MNRLCERFVFASLLSLLFLDPVAAAPPSPPANELVGTWTLDLTKESPLKGSQDQPNQVLLIIEADGWKLTVTNEGGSEEYVGGYTLDSLQTPKLLDITVRGDNDTQEAFAIYEINRGKLTIGARVDNARPADLRASEAEGLLKVTFVRQKTE
jgi:uncharacterized protein (TIGR03067 family)